MRYGLYGLHRDRNVESDVLVRWARLAEQAAFESLWVGDHIALPPGEGNPPGWKPWSR
jgi:alkanesulfonate monooxygenase SsuD/methylene tetrahydromethanopterin reductase-like flavin-dependent oxidoreductase (luciferase family)